MLMPCSFGQKYTYNRIQKCKDSELRLFVILGKIDNGVRWFYFTTISHLEIRLRIDFLYWSKIAAVQDVKAQAYASKFIRSMQRVLFMCIFQVRLNYCPHIPIICLITFGIFDDEFLLNIKVG
jgi:hypothetical protein